MYGNVCAGRSKLVVVRWSSVAGLGACIAANVVGGSLAAYALFWILVLAAHGMFNITASRAVQRGKLALHVCAALHAGWVPLHAFLPECCICDKLPCGKHVCQPEV
jgi:hypothetical protein